MKIYLLFYVIIMVILSIIYNVESDKEVILANRHKQTRKMFRENIIKEKLDNVIKENISIKRQSKMEDRLTQAGLNIGYTEYIMISVLSSIVMALIFGFLLNNVLLGIMFLFIGFFIPHQIVLALRNKRVAVMEKQVGAFMRMVIKRYQNTKDFNKALKMTEREFEGQKPLCDEIRKTVLDIELGVPTVKALRDMAYRTGNKYMIRFADYYEVTSEVGTSELREDLLTQAYEQYEENRQIQRELKQELSGPKQDAYIMLFSVPIFAIYQAISNPDYIYFMTHVKMGKIGTTVIIGTLLIVVWFINNKLGASINE